MQAQSYPKIAILMACYNGMKWIDIQIESILKQKEVDFDLYISVDKSDDHTLEYCENLSQSDSRVHLLKKGTRFGSASKNFFSIIEACPTQGYDYFALADQDDIWLEDKLFKAVSYLSSHQAVGYSSNVDAFWENGDRKLLIKSQPQKAFDYLFEAAGPGCTYVLKKAYFKEVQAQVINNKLSKSSLIHDWFIYAYARSCSYEWYIDPEPTLFYRQHQHNQIGANTSIRSLIKRAKIVFTPETIKNINFIICLGGKNNKTLNRWCGFSKKNTLNMMLHTYQFRRKSSQTLWVLAFLIYVFAKRKPLS